MPGRRYAIGYLGNGGFTEAIPALQRLLLDTTEKDLFRGDALLAIFRIDNVRGRRLANEYQRESGFVGVVADDIKAGAPYIHNRRTVDQALPALQK